MNCNPSLTENGWIKDINGIVDKGFADLLSSNQTQSYCFREAVLSLATPLQEFSGNPNGVSSNIGSIFTTYFSRFFDNVNTKVSYEEINPTIFDIHVSCLFTVNGNEYSVGKILKLNNKNVTQILDSIK